MDQFTNLTRYERVSLGRPFNLADGHARQYQDDAQLEICSRLPQMYRAGELALVPDLERDFQAAFFALAGQDSAIAHDRTALCPSATMSIDLIATFAGSHGWSVAVVEPCFDHLAVIMKRRGAVLVPLREEALAAPALSLPPADAILVTLPNNPTGFGLDRVGFTRLVAQCKAEERILILDWTFRFFSDLSSWDQYAILEQSGVSYLCVEDTGKTWPSLDLKCSILAASADLYPKVLDLHNEVVLNVSPFVLLLMMEYFRDSGRRGLDASVRWPTAVNRRRLREALRNSVLEPVAGRTPISVEWIRINSATVKSTDVVNLAAEVGIGILPGDHFFWHEPARGRKFVRLALAREPEPFAEACGRLEAMVARLPNLRGGQVVA